MSDKPVFERLQVKGERRLAVVGASNTVDQQVGAGARRAAMGEAEVVLAFTHNGFELTALLSRIVEIARPDAILWVAYPKLSSPLAGDLSRETVRQMADGWGLETIAQIAIDGDWSAMRLRRSR